MSTGKPTRAPAIVGVLKVDLPTDIRLALGDAAYRHRRLPGAEAEMLIREGLERHGFLAPLADPEPVERPV